MTSPPHKLILPNRTRSNPFGAKGVKKEVSDKLDWLVNRENSIHAAAVYSSEGQLMAQDTVIDLVSATDQDAFYIDLGLRDDVLAHMEAAQRVANKTNSRQPKTELAREFGKSTTAVRLTIDDQRYIGIAPIYGDYSYFLVATVLDRKGLKSNTRDFAPYNDQIYREDMAQARSEIAAILEKATD